MSEPISITATEEHRPFLTAAADLVRRGEPDSPYRFHFYLESDVLRAVAGHDFRYFCPSSAFALPELQRYLREAPWADEDEEIDLRPFAATPVVLLMRPEIHAALSSAGPVGWHSLLTRPGLRLMQAHPGSADGLAVVAAMATAAGEAAQLRLDTGTSGRHDEFVDALQSRVTEYGPGDREVAETALADGDWRADVLAVRESSAYSALARHPEVRAVLLHPADGTAWAHSVLGRLGPPPPAAEPAAAALVGALRDPGLNPTYAAHGVRTLSGDGAPSPAVHGVRARRGNGAPGAAYVQVVGSPGPPPAAPPARRLMRTLRRRGAALKRSANVCLLLDRSSSMAGHRLSAAKQGLTAFLDNLEGAAANASVIVFAGAVATAVPLQPVGAARAQARATLGGIGASGSTALLDAVSAALDVLDGADGPNLRAVVALTDGEENSSSHSAAEVERRLRDADVLFFGIAYGEEADRGLLERLARTRTGHSLVTDEHGVRAAYELITRHL